MSSIQRLDSHSHYATAQIMFMGKYGANGGTITTLGVNGNSRLNLSATNALLMPPNPSAYFALGGYWKPVLTGKVMEAAESAATSDGHVAVGVNVTDGTLSVWRAATGTAPNNTAHPTIPNYVPLATSIPGLVVANNWYNFEVCGFIDDAAGWVEVYINGNRVIRFDGDTRNSGTPVVSCLYILGNSTNGATWSGIWIGHDREGELRMDPQLPNANGSDRDWGRSSGTDDFSLVNEASVDTTGYLTTSTVGARTCVQKEVLRHSSGLVKAIQVVAYATKMDTGPCGLKMYLLMDGVRYYSPEFFPSLASWQGFPWTLPLQPVPGTPAWTQEAANNAQVGIERTT